MPALSHTAASLNLIHFAAQTPPDPQKKSPSSDFEKSAESVIPARCFLHWDVILNADVCAVISGFYVTADVTNDLLMFSLAVFSFGNIPSLFKRPAVRAVPIRDQ